MALTEQEIAELTKVIENMTFSITLGGKKPERQKGRSLVEFPRDYIAIDIETTGLDPRFDEVIELAAVRYANGVEVERFQTLVKPWNEISEFITQLTGITNEMLADAPSIEEALPGYREFLGGSVLVGHNVNFDINFLYDLCAEEGLPPLGNDFVDTMRLSRRLYKDLPNHKLPTVAEHLGVTDLPAHRALADCLCAAGCLEAMRVYADTIGGIPEPAWTHYNQLADRIRPETSDFDPESPVFGKVFAFTGKLELFTRAEAMQRVANAGGVNGDGVTKETNYLVLGSTDYNAALKGKKSNKHKKAEGMILKGMDIQIISEGTFLEMLGEGTK